MEITNISRVIDPRFGTEIGRIEQVNIGASRRSPEDAMKFVADISSISYGNEAAKAPEQLFNRLVSMGHLSCLEFVPVPMWMEVFDNGITHDPHNGREVAPLPIGSLRRVVAQRGDDWKTTLNWGTDIEKYVNKDHFCFRVTCTKDVNVQWLRHRNASYLEMSRRYVKNSKVPFTFSPTLSLSHIDRSLLEYQNLLDFGMTPQDARKVIPMGMMTTFYVAGNRQTYWDNYLRLRTDKHTQPDHKAFADGIQALIGIV